PFCLNIRRRNFVPRSLQTLAARILSYRTPPAGRCSHAMLFVQHARRRVGGCLHARRAILLWDTKNTQPALFLAKARGFRSFVRSSYSVLYAGARLARSATRYFLLIRPGCRHALFS